MEHIILAINPGSTTTKIGLFKGNKLIFKESIEHEGIEKYDSIMDQKDMRKEMVLQVLKKHGYEVSDLSCAVGRGGLLPPIHTGGYVVNEKLKDLLQGDIIVPHASNLGGILAYEISKEAGDISSYIYDAVSAGELPEIAQITGFPEVIRKSFCHVLNSRSVAIRYAESLNKSYNEMNLIVAHLGGGITVSVHKDGEIIDSLSDDNGPFSPERSGSVPLLDVIELCFSGKYTKKEMIKKVRGKGGLIALLGTSSCREIEERAKNGDERAKVVLEAQVLQIAKGIGQLAPVLRGKCDAIILTGGIANSSFITSGVKEYVEFIAKVEIIPGEFELEALAEGALRILEGKEIVHEL